MSCVDLRQLLEKLPLIDPHTRLDLRQEPIVLCEKHHCVRAELVVHFELCASNVVDEELSRGQVR